MYMCAWHVHIRVCMCSYICICMYESVCVYVYCVFICTCVCVCTRAGEEQAGKIKSRMSDIMWPSL